jgi:GT2 family glycosyltransferase
LPRFAKVDRVNRPARSDSLASPESRHDPLVTVVVVNYNAWPDVEELVESLARSTEASSGVCEVVVVDNASDGPVPTRLQIPPRGVRLIARRENGGFAVGVNTGWRAASSPWLLLLNPDVVVDSNFLTRVVERVLQFEQDLPRHAPGLLGFGLRNPDGSVQPSVGTFPSLARTVLEQLIPRSRRKYQAVWRTCSGPVDWVTGACMLVNHRMLEAVGGLDEDFFLYYEEVALCRSARSAGWRVEYDPTIEVVHLRPLQNRPVTPRLRVITRHSKLLYFRKHLPRWQFLSLCAIVAAESRLRGVLAWLRRNAEEQHSWRTVARVARGLRAGTTIASSEVRDLAGSVALTGVDQRSSALRSNLYRRPRSTRPRR